VAPHGTGVLLCSPVAKYTYIQQNKQPNRNYVCIEFLFVVLNVFGDDERQGCNRASLKRSIGDESTPQVRTNALRMRGAVLSGYRCAIVLTAANKGLWIW
jgi:hypothetical protein